MEQYYYCPVKSNPFVDDSGQVKAYCSLDALHWNPENTSNGKIIKTHQCSKDHQVKLLSVSVSTNSTDYVITNDMAHKLLNAV